MQKCYLALGCFWKPEETFRNIKGIVETEVGYAGGKDKKVTYEEVCTGNSGHAEVVRLTFDESKISFKKIYIYEHILRQIIGDKGSLKPMGFAKIPVAAAAME